MTGITWVAGMMLLLLLLLLLGLLLLLLFLPHMDVIVESGEMVLRLMLLRLL
jgi:hypothetical protein